MNVLIPMAGRGSRFADTGRYSLPKPLIDVEGKPMVLAVIDNLGMENAKYIFLILKDHEEIVRPVLSAVGEIVVVDSVTEGAACTCLLAKELINNDEPLLVANCDQIMDWSPSDFMVHVKGYDVDGCMITFDSDSPKNSYAKVNRHGYVTRVAEKEVISNLATTGVYYWSKGKFMVESCEKMIAKNIRTNNEFYLCPSYNEMIEDGLIVRTWHIQKHWPIGTPEDLETYLARSKDK